MANYDRRFKRLINDHYGTIREFAHRNKITYPTAYRYLRNPDAMTVGFVRGMSENLKVTISEIIGEGEE
jgi:predicted transcriptional regulator